jgi:hypothetical protein
MSQLLVPFTILSLVAVTSGPPAKAVDTSPAPIVISAAEAPSFKSLPSETQHENLLNAAKLAFARDQPRTGYEYVVRGCDLPQATREQ